MFKVPSNLIAPFSKLNTDPLDDKFDRLSSAISVYILVFCCLLAGTKLYVGEPIQCFSPANVPGTWHDFYTAYCFIQPKSKIPKNFTVDYDDHKNLDSEVAFYPVCLLFTSILSIITMRF
uniref:Innexin n=1 Tax=Panagrolaimus sp. JU765 TaxID=591449 RepID=A0AC34Q4F3_9BILA